jgi:hypothetical protein
VTDAPPLSRPLAVSSVPPEGVAVEIVADAAERAALAASNETESIETFVARLRVRPLGRDAVEVTGLVEAEATRLCVVTLEPFVEVVREEVAVRFAPRAPGEPDSEADDAPDPLIGDTVDLGAVAAEFFTLGLDLHPRKPDAVFNSPTPPDDDDASPFAALRAVARRGGDGE